MALYSSLRSALWRDLGSWSKVGYAPLKAYSWRTYANHYRIRDTVVPNRGLPSRPIAGLSNSPDDLSYLTPGHFLTGAPLLALPDASLLDRQESRLTRYQLVQQMRDRFWQVWRLDFLNSLQKRNKWHNQRANMSVGDIVIIKNDNAPPSRWELGRITQCFPGEDGLIRVCEVRTATSTFRRPIHKLCLLPIADRDEEDHNL